MHLTDYEDKEFSNYDYMDRWVLGKFSEMVDGFIKYLDEYEKIKYLEGSSIFSFGVSGVSKPKSLVIFPTFFVLLLAIRRIIKIGNKVNANR